MRTLGIGIAAAITLAVTVAPANAQGFWIGAPGFGVGIGVGPTTYYGGYRGGPYSAGLAMAMDTGMATSRLMPTKATPMNRSTATTPMLTCPMMAIRMDRACALMLTTR